MFLDQRYQTCLLGHIWPMELCDLACRSQTSFVCYKQCAELVSGMWAGLSAADAAYSTRSWSRACAVCGTHARTAICSSSEAGLTQVASEPAFRYPMLASYAMCITRRWSNPVCCIKHMLALLQGLLCMWCTGSTGGALPDWSCELVPAHADSLEPNLDQPQSQCTGPAPCIICRANPGVESAHACFWDWTGHAHCRWHRQLAWSVCCMKHPAVLVLCAGSCGLISPEDWPSVPYLTYRAGLDEHSWFR